MAFYPKDAAAEAVEDLKLTGEYFLSSSDKFRIQTWVLKKYPYMGVISQPTIYKGFGKAKAKRAKLYLEAAGLHYKVTYCGCNVYIKEEGSQYHWERTY